MDQTAANVHIPLPMKYLVMKAYFRPNAGLSALSKASPGALKMDHFYKVQLVTSMITFALLIN